MSDRGRALVLVLLMAVMASGCWVQDGGDAAHRGFAAGEVKITPANASTLQRSWLSTDGSPTTSPVVMGSTVFAAGPASAWVAGGVTAYGAKDGSTRWHALTYDPSFDFFSFKNLTIDGAGLEVPYEFGSGGGYGTLDLSTGAMVGHEGGFHQAPLSSKVVRNDVTASMTGFSGSGIPVSVILNYGDKKAALGCCDFSSLRPTEPSIVGRHVVVAIGAGLYSYSLDTCVPFPSAGFCGGEWISTLPSPASTPVGLDDTSVAVSGASGDITVLDVATGATTWTGHTTTTALTRVAVGRDAVFAGGADGKLYAFAKSGCGAAVCAPVWSAVAGTGSITAPPVVAGSVVFVGNASGKIVALPTTCATTTCAPLWTGTAGDPARPGGVSGIAVDDGSVYATTSGGSIAAFRLP